MHIHLLNHNNIEGKGLSVLLGNEGHQVDFISCHDKLQNHLPSTRASSLLLINVEFLAASKSEALLGNLNSGQTILLLGKLHELHWLVKIPAKNKGFICKESTHTDLLGLLHKVRKQENMLGDRARIFLEKTNLKKQRILLQKDLQKPLSKTELLLMCEISKGKTTKQIANEKHLSIHTIYNHRKNISQKFQSSKKTALSRFCMLRGDAIQTLILINEKHI